MKTFWLVLSLAFFVPACALLGGMSTLDSGMPVVAARGVQAVRFAGTRTRLNGKMTTRQIRQFCKLDEASQQLLKAGVQELGLSARAHDKVLRVARTIADLAGSAAIRPEHLSEAMNYRMLDRNLWT